MIALIALVQVLAFDANAWIDTWYFLIKEVSLEGQGPQITTMPSVQFSQNNQYNFK